MSALRTVQRLAAANGIGFPCSSLRLVRNSSLCLRLGVGSNGHNLQVASRSFRSSSIRYISQANKDKVIERNEAIKRDSTIEVCVKKIISEQLRVKTEEISAQTASTQLALEEELDTEIPEEEAEKITTVQAAIGYINGHRE